MGNKGIVDRIVSGFVVIEVSGQTQDVERSLVADDVREGDAVVLQDGRWIKDHEETKRRSEHIRNLMDQLWED